MAFVQEQQTVSLCNAKGPVKTMNAKRKEVYEQLKCNNSKFVVLHTEHASMHFLNAEQHV